VSLSHAEAWAAALVVAFNNRKPIHVN
jgi:hypothetical protein